MERQLDYRALAIALNRGIAFFHSGGYRRVRSLRRASRNPAERLLAPSRGPIRPALLWSSKPGARGQLRLEAARGHDDPVIAAALAVLGMIYGKADDCRDLAPDRY